jgi:sorting nexin-25
LFGDEDEEGEDDEDYVQVQRMEAIQAALNEIIASDDALGPRRESVAVTRMSPEPEDLKSPSASMILMGAAEKADPTLTKAASRSVEDLRSPQLPRLDTTSRVLSPVERKASDPPALPQRRSTSNLLGGGSRGKLFDDEVAEEDEVGDEDMEGEPIEVVQLAAPGDLQLSVEIARLQDKILDLVKQEHLLDSLIRQAELTGNQTELRILRRSQSSVRREQRTAIFQKAQFEQQEEENRLVPGRTKVDIPSAVVTTEEGEGKQVVRYTIEVKQVGEDGAVRVAWVVARRYNEFWELDRAIKEWAITSGDHTLLEEVRWKIAELPGKKLVPNVSSSFIESRKLGLEKYLQVGPWVHALLMSIDENADRLPVARRLFKTMRHIPSAEFPIPLTCPTRIFLCHNHRRHLACTAQHCKIPLQDHGDEFGRRASWPINARFNVHHALPSAHGRRRGFWRDRRIVI